MGETFSKNFGLLKIYELHSRFFFCNTGIEMKQSLLYEIMQKIMDTKNEKAIVLFLIYPISNYNRKPQITQ